MSLYSFIARKDELLDLMVVAVVGETLLDAVPGDWRTALSSLAYATRDVCLAHPWLVAATSDRVQLGPNSMRHLEQSLQAVTALGIDRTRKLAILHAVDTYALGQVAVRQARESEQLQDPVWRASAEAYLATLIDSGEFPNLAALGMAGMISGQPDQAEFDIALNWLLDGIAAQLSRYPR